MTMTSVTREHIRTGKRVDPSLHNRKPFRGPRLKIEARENARKCDDGTFRSSTRVEYHPEPK